MKRLPLFLFACFSFFLLQAQPRIKEKKYPSLLWEITGNGTKKPSYLIGTMHVSSKIAFNLPDSFYIAVKNAQVVALETNPETWQEDMSKYDLGEGGEYGGSYGDLTSLPEDYLSISTLKFYRYDAKIERALFSNPSTINNLLYRSYGNESSDFEEDTYLDMYIYQCGKKLGKKVTGVESYGESMRLMAEAYKDAAKDKNRKDRSYGDMDEEYSMDKLQEAYRKGDLDLLDSINSYNSFSAAFDEKFLYKRNEIQANSIDSILRSGSVLFVGVGAAHLPGQRGVIEMLRAKGYKLRPVKMGERASKEKEMLEKIRVPVTFKTETAEDGFFKVDIPGKFYKFGEDPALDQQQYADMANGSYYMVTRIMTNAWMWNHSAEDVLKKVDSLLYENVPGKIISKTSIIRNGYKGFDITNRTRRGDLQRYNILVTPFEVFFFKMSGNGDYVKLGEEGKRFFGSIQLKEYKNGTEGTTGWKKYSPVYGGFMVDLPHVPYIGNDGSWIFDAEDKSSNTQYRVIRTDIHNYNFAEEDTFDLGLMEESFMASEFIDTTLFRNQTNHKGYPALDAKYKDKQGFIYMVRYIIQGPHYYTLVTHGRQEADVMKNFINSFEIKPFVYRTAKPEKDTSLYFSVTTPVFPEEKKIKLDIPRYSWVGAGEDEDEESEDFLLESGAFRNKIVSNDTTGEKIYISFYRSPRYYYSKDSTLMDRERFISYRGDSTWIVKLYRKSELPGKIKVHEVVLTDTGSSRTIWGKTFYKDGINFSLTTQSDTLTPASDFVKKFYETFTPADTLKGVNPFVKKSDLFFDDLMSTDSVLRKKAIKNIDDIYLDSADLPKLKKAISWINWEAKKYLDTKKMLINKLGNIKSKSSADYLKELYYILDDTVQLQYPVLENLLQHKTSYAYNVFRDIISTEPPVLDLATSDYPSYTTPSLLAMYEENYRYDDGKFLDELSDSLQLTKTILPELLPLLNLDDYKSSIMEILGKMADSSIVQPKDYEVYFSKFILEAKQELKKQSIAEKKKAIKLAEESKTDEKPSYYYRDEDEADKGNEDLSLYATLLIPFWETKPAVKPLIEQMLASYDKKLKYKTMLQLIKSNRPYPDTLLKYFGKLDDYRYILYDDLRQLKKSDKFPSFYNNHLDLGKSALLNEKSYGRPDSLVYVDRLKATYKDKKGFIYFFKYKAKKDDLTWKLATVGLVPENPREFQFEDTIKLKFPRHMYELFNFRKYNRYNFTGFTDVKVNTDGTLTSQLEKELKKLLYARRKSAKEFYEGEKNGFNMRTHID
ncbi:MAG TPA: TraB/GumN family protein [Chitinophagaceae bacterium]|nr:TraB/GumN family protein [Chitinophagaceae bacterium]